MKHHNSEMSNHNDPLEPPTEVFDGNVKRTHVLGEPWVLVSCFPGGRYEATFEDDSETGYLYGTDHQFDRANPIVDACLIYQKLAPRPVEVMVVWHSTRPKVWLVMDGSPQAAFDFEAKRCWCHSNFPEPFAPWTKEPKAWSEEAMADFGV